MYKLLLVCLMALIVMMGCSKSSEKPAETTADAPAPMPAMEAVTLAVTGMT
jgi:uncharacterized lipoprotein YajG